MSIGRVRPVIMKFGGTSVGSAERIAAVAQIVRQRIDGAPVVVVSAMAGVTDRLLELSVVAAHGSESETRAAVEALERRHREACAQLLVAPHRQPCEAALGQLFATLRYLVGEAAFQGESSPAMQDAIASLGERLASVLVAARLAADGVDVRLEDSRAWVKTDASFGAAHLLVAESDRRIQAGLEVAPGRTTVVQGFIGSTMEGETTTLGRGGSDYSAGIYGAALGAREVEIWTDVSGVMSCDPRLVPDARTVACMSYDEAIALASLGGKVLHPLTMRPAVGSGVPISIRNSLAPDSPSTVVSKQGSQRGAVAVSVKKGLVLLTLSAARDAALSEFLSSAFAVLEQYGTAVVATAIAGKVLTVVVEDGPWGPDCVEALRRVADVTAEHGVAIVAVIGDEAWRADTTWRRALGSLQGFEGRVRSCSVAGAYLAFVADAAIVSDAVSRLHAVFFDEPAAPPSGATAQRPTPELP